jgi:hypothetical protein
MKIISTFIVWQLILVGLVPDQSVGTSGKIEGNLISAEVTVAQNGAVFERHDGRSIVNNSIVQQDTLKPVSQDTLHADTLRADTLRADTLRVDTLQTVSVDTLILAQPDSLPTTPVVQPDTLARTVQKPGLRDRIRDFLVNDFDIYPLRMGAYPGSEVVLTDSTVRWNQWIEYADRLSRSPGVISYRLGGFNRTDYYLMDGRGLEHQRLYIEGMSAVNPVLGNPVYATLPLERMSHITQSDLNVSQRSDLELQKYYLRKPLTRITYDQSTFELRSTDAHVSQMINRQAGVDIAYLGKNNGAEYNRFLTESRQASARIFYNYSSRYLIQTLLLYNGIQHQESDGYAIADMFSFNYSRFFADPLRLNAESSYRNTQLQISVQRRAKLAGNGRRNFSVAGDIEISEGAIDDGAAADTVATSGNAEFTETAVAVNTTSSVNDQVSTYTDARFMVYHDRTRRFYYAQTDTSFYRVLSYHATAMRLFRQQFYTIQAELRSGYYYMDGNRSPSLSVDNWSTLESELNMALHPGPVFYLPVHARYKLRSDSFTEWETGLGVLVSPFSLLRFGIYGSMHQKIPTMQQLHWRGSIVGNSGLVSELHQRASIKLGLGRESGPLQAEITAYVTEQDRLTVVGVDSMFAQVGGVGQWGGVARAWYHTRRWEVDFSTTLQQYTGGDGSAVTESIVGSGLRIWNRGSIHWKGYLFDNATFVKAGLYGIFSPNSYRTAKYIPVADFWDISQIELEIPGFIRFDAELSARVRTMFVLVRWENFTQGYLEDGYFETANYPMPSQRLRFGIRVIFSN